MALSGFFAAVVMGAVLSTFNSVLNSAATIFSLDIYKRHFKKDAGEKRLVWIGRSTSSILAFFAICCARNFSRFWIACKVVKILKTKPPDSMPNAKTKAIEKSVMFVSAESPAFATASDRAA